MRINVTAAAASEGSDWGTKLASVWVGCSDGGRNGTAMEEPDAETGRSPLDCVDTAADRVEAGTVAADVWSVKDTTANVVGAA